MRALFEYINRVQRRAATRYELRPRDAGAVRFDTVSAGLLQPQTTAAADDMKLHRHARHRPPVRVAGDHRKRRFGRAADGQAAATPTAAVSAAK